MIPILLTLEKDFYNFSSGKQIGLLKIDSDGYEVIRTYSKKDRCIDFWVTEERNQYINLLITKV